MTDLHLLWYALAVAGIAGSALASGVETGIYTLNRIRLHVLAHTPGSGASILQSLINRQSRAIVTLLVGSNLFDYLSSLAIGNLLDEAGYKQWAQVAINAAILTPAALIFGQIVPKDIFRSHGDLTYYFARPLAWLQGFLTLVGIIPLVEALTRLLRHITGQTESPEAITHPRRVITTLMREGLGHGVISHYQSNMIDRAMELGHLTVVEVMQPWKSVASVRTNQGPDAVWSLADRTPYSRLPLLDPTGQPTGLIEVNQVLTHDPKTCPPLESLARPVAKLPRYASLPEALQTLQQTGSSMGIVLDHRRPIGLVTIKDLIEPLVGELEAL